MKKLFISIILSLTLLIATIQFDSILPKSLHFISPSYSTYCDTPLSR